MAEHTPGPWHDDGYRIHAPTDDEDKRNGRVIVEYKHVDGFNDADAPLIAAAPELLEAIDDALRLYDEGMKSREAAERTWASGEVPKAWAKCRAAIAKARGDVPPRR